MGLLDQDIEILEEGSESSWKGTTETVGGCLLQLLFGIGGIALIVLLIQGVPWIAENVYPWVSLICSGFAILVLPISIILAFFKKTRLASSIGFLLSSFALFINLWFSSLILSYLFAGTFWMVVGLIFGGIGVIPLALIASLLVGQWSAAIQIIVGIVFAYGPYALGGYLSEYDEKPSEELESETKEFVDDLLQQAHTDRIVEGFGKFLEKNQPLISDIKTLPYPKGKIETALSKKEQQLCDMANDCVRTGNKEQLPELEKFIGAVGSCRVFLKSYAEIEAEDREDVDYFNDYNSQNEIPQDEKTEFGMLRAKYMTKWLNEDNQIEIEPERTLGNKGSIDTVDYELVETDEIVGYFLKFIDDQPLIHDVELLHYSQDEIGKSLIRKEHQLHAAKFRSEQSGNLENVSELEKLIGSVSSARELLASYVEVDPDDYENVDYFNGFASEYEVPREQKANFEALRAKYLLRWKDNTADG